MSIISLVYAQSRNGVIGHDGGLPWHVPSDLKRFKAATLGKPVIMGRKTWDSLPRKPLPGRLNIVVTRQAGFKAEGATVVHAPEAAITAAGDAPEVCVIGGADLFRLYLPKASRIYLTVIDLDAVGDVQAPSLAPGDWAIISEEWVEKGPNDSAGFWTRVLERRPSAT